MFVAVNFYEEIVAGSAIFYLSTITTVLFFVVDYCNWMLAITTPNKTDNEAWALIAWTTSYVVLYILHWVPLITVVFAMAQIILFGDGNILKNDNLKEKLGDGAKILIPELVITLIRVVCHFIAMFYNTVKIFRTNDPKLRLESDKLSNDPIWKRILKVMYSLFLHGCLYITSLWVTCVIPFAGGKYRTLLNSLLFAIQYTVLFLQICFAEQGHATTLDVVKVYDNFVNEKILTLSSRLKIITTTITPQRICILLVIISWVLFYVTFYWFLHKSRRKFLENDVDYLNRNARGAPDYYENAEYFDRHDDKYDEIDRLRMDEGYLKRLHYFDPFNKIEYRRVLGDLLGNNDTEDSDTEDWYDKYLDNDVFCSCACFGFTNDSDSILNASSYLSNSRNSMCTINSNDSELVRRDINSNTGERVRQFVPKSENIREQLFRLRGHEVIR